MCGEANREPGLSASIAKPIRKAGGQVRLSPRRGDESQSISWHRIDRGAQFIADRNHQRLAGLLLAYGNHIAAYVLTTHLHEFIAPLASAECQRESKPRHGADRVPRFEGSYV